MKKKTTKPTTPQGKLKPLRFTKHDWNSKDKYHYNMILVYCPHCDHCFVDVLRDYLFETNKSVIFICPFCTARLRLW